MSPSPLAPGARIGILGGGQLGRMLSLAAAPLGYSCHIYAPETDPPAGQVAAAVTAAAYDDLPALDRFAAAVDVVTYEFENVPAACVAHLAQRVPVRPGAAALDVAQDRLSEKTFANRQGAATAPFRAVDSATELAAALDEIGHPAILKTRRLGYDGKGQVRIAVGDDPATIWSGMQDAAAILEGFVAFEREISVIAARGLDGRIVAYPPVENEHKDGILHISRVPARFDAAVADRASAIVADFLAALDYVGVLAVEFFVTADGGLLVNEMAPRVHNSGHWSIEGAVTSQFEQHIRAICGLPLGSPCPTGEIEMLNLIGDDAADTVKFLEEPDCHLHLYGKAEIKPGRKMGHVTRVRRTPA